MDKRQKSWIEDIYRRRVQEVYRFCRSIVGREGLAEDLTQETFMRLIRSQPQFANPAHEQAWLFLTARRLCYDHFKQAESQNQSLDADPQAWQTSSPAPYAHSEFADLLDLLTPEQRPVIYLYYAEGYKTEEIAQILGHKPATVRQQLKRARDRLAQQLGQEVKGGIRREQTS